MKLVTPDNKSSSLKMSRPTEASHGSNRHTVYFDGSCPLCTLEIKHYASRAGKEQINFVDVSSNDTVLDSDLTRGEAMNRFHVRLPNGSLVSGATAFVTLWHITPGWRWAARVARVPGILPILERAYQLFLPTRPLLARLTRRLGALRRIIQCRNNQ